MFRRLRNRLLILNMAIISIVIIAAFAIIYISTYTDIQKENQSKLESLPRLPSIVLGNSQFYDPQSGQFEKKVVFRGVPVNYTQSFVILINNDGQIMDVLSYIDIPEEDYRQIAQKAWSTGKSEGSVSFKSRKWQYSISTFEKRILIREDGEPQIIDGSGYYQIAFLDITDSSQTLTRLLLTFVLVGTAVLFILFVVSFYFANRSIRPIEENWQKQKQFVADASHELKTPLAIIGANADALLANGEETINSQKKWLDYIKTEAGRMGKLINDMLYLAKVEDTDENQLPIDFSHAVRDVVASLEAVIFEKGIQLTQHIEPRIIVRGNEEKIKQAVLILLDNAIKYSGDRGDVAIALKRFRNQAVLSIQNSGEGIPADRLPKIFDRFYRCDPSRTKETGGFGLGLSIARAIIERSGGSIYAESSDSGTTFTIELKTT